MGGQHPHFGATYRIALQPDGNFGVEVSIPDASPVTVTGFATEKLASAWVANHQRQIAGGAMLPARRPWKK